MPLLFQNMVEPPFSYYNRARELFEFFSFKTLEDEVQFVLVDGSSVVLLPATDEQAKQLWPELTSKIILAARAQMQKDLGSKENLDSMVDINGHRLEYLARSAAARVLNRTRADPSGVRILVGRYLSPILCGRWRQVLADGIQPYSERGIKNQEDSKAEFIGAWVARASQTVHEAGQHLSAGDAEVSIVCEDILVSASIDLGWQHPTLTFPLHLTKRRAAGRGLKRCRHLGYTQKAHCLQLLPRNPTSGKREVRRRSTAAVCNVDGVPSCIPNNV